MDLAAFMVAAGIFMIFIRDTYFHPNKTSLKLEILLASKSKFDFKMAFSKILPAAISRILFCKNVYNSGDYLYLYASEIFMMFMHIWIIS